MFNSNHAAVSLRHSGRVSHSYGCKKNIYPQKSVLFWGFFPTFWSETSLFDTINPGATADY